MLDSGASVHIMRNVISDTELRMLNNTMIVGVGGKGLKATYEGNNKCIGKFVVVPDARSNLISISELTKFGAVILFKGIWARLSLGHHNHDIRKSQEGLYYVDKHVLKELLECTKFGYTADLSVSETIRYSHTPKQIQRANEIKKLHYLLDHPSNLALRQALKHGCIINTNLVPEDISLYEEICGECPHCIAGKMHRESYKSSNSMAASVIGERIHMDLKPYRTSQYGGYTFLLLTVDEFSGYLFATSLKTKSGTADIFPAILSVIAWYKSHNHIVKEILMDSESSFVTLKNEIRALGIQPYYTTPYQHAQRMERYVQTINCRIRSIISSLSYNLPENLYSQVLYEVLDQMNLVPNYLHRDSTPAILFAGRKYDVSKWLKPPFGTTVLCYVQSENSDPRAELGIVLSYFDSSSNNSYNVWSVNSQRIVVRRNCKVLKATPSDLKLKAKDPILPSHIPDFIESPYYSHLPESGEETYREEGAIYAATNRNESITTSIARGNDDGLSQHPVESRISDALDDEIVGVTESPVMQSDVIIRENEAVNEGHIAPTEMRSQENEAVNEGHIAPTEMRGQENEAVNEGHETEHSARECI